MDHPTFTGDKSVRLSGSPAGSPRIVNPPSPTRSVHLMADPSMNDFDFEMRTQDAFEGRRDFFEDSSDEELETADELAFSQRGNDSGLENRRSGPRRSKRSTVVGPSAGNYAFLCNDDDRRYPSTRSGHGFLRRDSTTGVHSRGSSPYNGSMEDVNVGKSRHKPRQNSHGRSSRHTATPRKISGNFEDDAEAARSMADQILGAHAITMQALLRDEVALDPTAQRNSADFDHKRIRSASLPTKKVSMVPPPINIAGRPLGEGTKANPKTPYPFVNRKRSQKPSPLSTSELPTKESVLTISIRRHGNVLSSRIAQIVIPPMPELEDNPAKETPTKTGPDPKDDEKFPEEPEFDDEALFREMRSEYHRLSGVWRLFSARVLKKITVGHSRVWADQEKAPLNAYYLRSSRFLASRGLHDTFSEDNLMENYHSPKLGRLRHTWVHWAIKLASSSDSVWASMPSTPNNIEQLSHYRISTASGNQHGVASQVLRGQSTDSSDEEPAEIATLEFVEGWSVGRICFALFWVLLLSVAGVLLWTFFGTGALRSGIQGAGARLGTGLLVGVLVLMLGWTVVLGWMGLSWMVI